MVTVVKQLSSMLIRISLILQYIILLGRHALSWTLNFNRELGVHLSRSQDLVLAYMLVTLHLMQVQLHLVLIQEQDTYLHNFMLVLMTTSQQFRLWRRMRFPPHWAELVENSCEKVTEENYEIARTWLFPDADPGDISMPKRNQNVSGNYAGLPSNSKTISHNVPQKFSLH